jgi:hypothetical protein
VNDQDARQVSSPEIIQELTKVIARPKVVESRIVHARNDETREDAATGEPSWKTYFARIAKAVGPCWLVLVILTAAAASANETDLVPRLQQGGHALMMRHAHAPGFGDPPLFSLDNCDTQRNLDHNGRAQAVGRLDFGRADIRTNLK